MIQVDRDESYVEPPRPDPSENQILTLREGERLRVTIRFNE